MQVAYALCEEEKETRAAVLRLCQRLGDGRGWLAQWVAMSEPDGGSRLAAPPDTSSPTVVMCALPRGTVLPGEGIAKMLVAS